MRTWLTLPTVAVIAFVMPAMLLAQTPTVRVRIHSTVQRGIAVDSQAVSSAVLRGFARDTSRAVRRIDDSEAADVEIRAWVQGVAGSARVILNAQVNAGVVRTVQISPPATPDSGTLIRAAETLGFLLTRPAPPSRAAAQPQGWSGSKDWSFLFGLQFGRPEDFSVAVGAAFVPSRELGPGPFVAVEPGYRAGRISAGYTWIRGSLATGSSLRASLLRRYRGSESQTFVGVEGQLIILGLGPRMGAFRSSNGAPKTLVSVGAGFGL